jgi:hypothetical protein
MTGKGPEPDPITVQVDGRDVVCLQEWSEMRSARDTLLKLILAVRFHRKLHPIWNSLDTVQKRTNNLGKKYTAVRAFSFCLKACCMSDLTQFYGQWGARFGHSSFSSRCCSAGVNLPMRCGFLDQDSSEGQLSDD